MKYSLIIVAFFLLWGCSSRNNAGDITPAQLMMELNEGHHLTDAIQVAHWIIDKHPTLKLVDVRSNAEFEKFTLPGSINIPISEMQSALNQQLPDCDKQMLVFFSNDDLYAEQAWIVLRQLGCKNNLVLKGGLNAWIETIIKITPSVDFADSESLELYEFQKAARQYMIGASKPIQPEPYVQEAKPEAASPKKSVNTQVKKKASAQEEEGC
jgi:rhodanese-related sulfurtransferase